MSVSLRRATAESQLRSAHRPRANQPPRRGLTPKPRASAAAIAAKRSPGLLVNVTTARVATFQVAFRLPNRFNADSVPGVRGVPRPRALELGPCGANGSGRVTTHATTSSSHSTAGRYFRMARVLRMQRQSPPVNGRKSIAFAALGNDG
jgi:hypothetical protein